MPPLALAAAFLFLSPPASARGNDGFKIPKIDFHKQADAPVLERVEQFSAGLRGVKYKEGPLGEGPDGEFDSDPLYRFDLVDCVTFVEETLALARARDKQGMLDELLKIRYRGGVVSYQTRNHFTEADWIPNNVAAGVIRDITREAGGSDAWTAGKLVSKRAWYAAKTVKDLEGPRIARLSPAEKNALVARWRALGANIPDERVSLDYIPVDKLADHLDAIPSGTIASLVRGDNPKAPTMVSHMGLLVKVDGKAYFRHAALGDKVVDVPLDEYFRKYEGSSWPLLGVNLTLPLEP